MKSSILNVVTITLVVASVAVNPLNAQEPILISSTSKNFRIEEDGVISSSERFPDRATAPWSITRETLVGGMQDGVELIHVDNGKLKFTVIPTRGMSVREIQCGDLRLGWNSPVKQIVHPSNIDLNDHGGLGWLTGFNETMVRCGVSFAGHPGEDNGKMLTLHGRIGNTPAAEVSVVVEDKAPYRIRIRGKVEERMFKFGVFDLWTEVSTIPGSASIQFDDRLVNNSKYEQEYQMIYHTNFGTPILEKAAAFVAPVKTVAPFDEYAAQDLGSYQAYQGPTNNFGEQVYCLTLNADDAGMTTAMLHNSAADKGVAMQWSVESLPFFTLWKNTDTESDGYVTGLEPGTGFPYNRSIERTQNRVPKLAANGEVHFHLTVAALESAAAVAETTQTIQKIQGSITQKILTTPPRPKELKQ